MSAPVSVNLEKVVDRLSQQVAALSAELAMCHVALGAAHERIAELTSDVPQAGDLQDQPNKR